MNYDANPVQLLYNDEELSDRINMVMDSRDHTTGITFVNLCYQLVQMAFQERKVKKADENTTLTSEELSAVDQVRVSRILWELIWNHKIFLLFGRSELLGLSNGEDRFVKYWFFPKFFPFLRHLLGWCVGCFVFLVVYFYVLLLCFLIHINDFQWFK